MRKYLVIIGFLLILVVSACSNNDHAVNEENDNNVAEDNNENNVNEENNENQPENNDETEVSITGEATYEDNLLTVKGETNLPEEASVFIMPDTMDNSTFINVSGSANVEADGSFLFEQKIPSKYESGLDVKIRFRPEDQSEDSVKEIYGESGEHLEGPFVRLYESRDELKHEASTFVFLPLDDDGSASGKITAPDWQEPEDYGDENIRIEVDTEINDEFIYVEGESNLIEGSEVSVRLHDAEGSFTKSSVIRENVSPDGSFRGPIDISEMDEEMDGYEIKVKFKPTEFSWENVSEHYGTGGENMSGDLVEDFVDDQEVIMTTPLE